MGECFITESIPNLASFRVFSRRPPKDIAPALCPCTKPGQSKWRQYSVKWNHKGGRVGGCFQQRKITTEVAAIKQ